MLEGEKRGCEDAAHDLEGAFFRDAEGLGWVGRDKFQERSGVAIVKCYVGGRSRDWE